MQAVGQALGTASAEMDRPNSIGEYLGYIDQFLLALVGDGWHWDCDELCLHHSPALSSRDAGANGHDHLGAGATGHGCLLPLVLEEPRSVLGKHR